MLALLEFLAEVLLSVVEVPPYWRVVLGAAGGCLTAVAIDALGSGRTQPWCAVAVILGVLSGIGWHMKASG